MTAVAPQVGLMARESIEDDLLPIFYESDHTYLQVSRTSRGRWLCKQRHKHSTRCAERPQHLQSRYGYSNH